MEKLHTVKIEEASGSNIVKINNIVTIQDDPVMQQMLRGGIDWVPKEILSLTVNKAIALTTTPGAVMCQSNETVIVSSLSNPRKPHIVNIFSNGKN